jgi:tetratricopeptide (TPR) repeat protein
MLLLSAAGAASNLEAWVKTEDAAADASRVGHFRDAEALLLSNQKLAETLPPKDARLPRTLFDLAQVYRAEGKYSEALGLYERARQIYGDLYGAKSVELAQTLDGEGELYKSLGDFAQAEPLLAQILPMHVDAIRAAIDLRAPQFDEVQKRNFQSGLMKVAFKSEHGMKCAGGNFGAFDTRLHKGFSLRGFNSWILELRERLGFRCGNSRNQKPRIRPSSSVKARSVRSGSDGRGVPPGVL